MSPAAGWRRPAVPDSTALGYGALGRYLDELARVKKRSDHTLRNYRRDIGGFFDHLAALGVPFDRAGREAARGYLSDLLWNGTAAASVKRCASTIRAFYAWLERQGELQPAERGDSILRLRFPKAPRLLPRFLEQEESSALMDAPDRETPRGLRDRALLELLYGAGLRVSELASIDTAHLDMVNRQVTVDGKGNRPRVCLFGEAARAALAEYIERGRPALARGAQAALLLNRSGGRLSVRSIQTVVRSAGVAASILQPVYPHLLRHSFATHMLDKGADLRVVQHLLGHTSVDTTQIYTAVTRGRRDALVAGALARARLIEADGGSPGQA